MTLKNLDAVSADGTVQQVVHEIRFRLEGALDPESGVLHYQVGVGTNSTPLSIVPYKVFKPRVAEYHLLSGLQLPQGPLSLRVKAWNRAYDETTPVDLYLGVDSFSPECEPMSIDGNAPGRLLQWTTDASKIRASWTCVDAIPWQAKALRCQFAVGLFPQDDSVVPWADSLQNASHGVVVYPPEPLKNGFLYYASVRCVDQVNLEGKQSSGGLLVDIHPPKISAPVQLKRALSGQLAGLQAEWVNGVDPLVLTWAFLDSESGISSIRAQLQSTAAVELDGGANAGYATANNNFSIASLAYGLPPTPAIRRLEVNISNLFGAGIELPLEQNGTYFLHACATDHVGWSDCSPPYEFRVDRTPPFLLALADTQNGLPVPAISSILAGFETDWQFGENESTVFTSSWMPYMEVGGVITALDDAPLLNDGAEGVAVVAVLPRVRWCSVLQLRRRRQHRGWRFRSVLHCRLHVRWQPAASREAEQLQWQPCRKRRGECVLSVVGIRRRRFGHQQSDLPTVCQAPAIRGRRRARARYANFLQQRLSVLCVLQHASTRAGRPLLLTDHRV